MERSALDDVLRYNRLMRRPLLAAAAVLGLTVLISAAPLAHSQSNPQKEPPAQEFAPDVPDAIAVPAGETVQFFVMAKGSQIYTCQAGADGKFTWTLKGPEAELRDRKDKVIGQHFADPTTKLPNLETERRQRSLRQSRGPRRLARRRLHPVAAGKCREPRGKRPAHKHHDDSTRPHARRQAR